MKHYISAVLAATAILGLAACGGGVPEVSSSSASESTAQASLTVPDVKGKPFTEAKSALRDQGFTVALIGKDGEEWANVVPNRTVTVVSTDPAAGTVTKPTKIAVTVNVTQSEFIAARNAKDDATRTAAELEKVKAELDAEATKLATRYSFTCSDSSYSTAGRGTFKDFRLIWPTKHYNSADRCMLSVGGKDPSTTIRFVSAEQALIDLVAAKGGDVSAPGATVGKVISLCAKLPGDYADQGLGNSATWKAEAEAALSMCPDAPHAALLQEAMTAVKYGDGNKIVGQTMEPGTYKTNPKAEDCYWSRNTGGGDIIANDFVGFAPNGVTVTVYPGEGFESQRCGVWTKIG